MIACPPQTYQLINFLNKIIEIQKGNGANSELEILEAAEAA